MAMVEFHQSNIKVLTADNFDQIISDHDIVLIDFWARWCHPCLVFAEVFESVAARYEDCLFAKVDIEKETVLAADFQIRSIPYLAILRQGVMVYANSGALPEAALIDLIEQAKKIDPDTLHSILIDKK